MTAPARVAFAPALTVTALSALVARAWATCACIVSAPVSSSRIASRRAALAASGIPVPAACASGRRPASLPFPPRFPRRHLCPPGAFSASLPRPAASPPSRRVARPAIAAFSAAVSIGTASATPGAFSATIAIATAASTAIAVRARLPRCLFRRGLPGPPPPGAFPAVIAAAASSPSPRRVAATSSTAVATAASTPVAATSSTSIAAGAVAALGEGCPIQDGHAGAMAEVKLNPKGKSSSGARYRDEDMSPPTCHDHLVTALQCPVHQLQRV